MFKLALQLSTAAVLITVAIRQCIQLARHRHDLALRVLAPGQVALSVTATIGISGFPPSAYIFALLYRLDIGGVVSNGSWMAMAYCFATFFALADTTRDVTARKQAAIRGLILLVAVIVATQIILPHSNPTAFLGGPEKYRHWENIVNTGLILGYDLTFWGIGIRRAIRYQRTVNHVWLRLSLRLVIVGVAAMAVGVDGMDLVKGILRLAIPGSFRFEPTSVIYITGLLGGQAALAIGLVLPALAAGVLRAQRHHDRMLQRRYRRQMAPLWRDLVDAFPYIVLPRNGVPNNRTAGERDFERTMSEITDGLAELSPYYAAVVGIDSSCDTDMSDPRAVAVGVRAALDAHATGAERVQPPYPRIEPDFREWRARARWMVQLSVALDKSGARTVDGVPERRS